MSNLSRFMHTAREILDDADRKKTGDHKPPFFTRTTWLFAELELLAMRSEENIFTRIKVARLSKEVTALVPLLDLLDANTGMMESGPRRLQRAHLVVWIKEQIARETSNAGR
jgi:hypothetical protein